MSRFAQGCSLVAASVLAAALAAGAEARQAVGQDRAGALSVVQLTTTDPKGLVAEWSRPDAHVDIHGTRQTVRNQPISAFIVFKGCRADAAGDCDLTAEMQMVDPSGKPTAMRGHFVVWPKSPPVANNMLALSRDAPAITFGNSDPLGRYVLRTAVTDHVAGVTVETESAVLLHQ